MTSDPRSPAAEPWLHGIVACGLRVEAVAVRRALAVRGLQVRSVPAGAARGAWTAVAGRRTVAVVLSGSGAAAARAAAGFWMPRTRRVVVAGAAEPTGLVEPPALVLDGDPGMLVAARLASAAAVAAIPVAEAPVASVTSAPRSEQARAALREAGIAAVDHESDTWRAAAQLASADLLVCRSLMTGPPPSGPEPAGSGRPGWLRGLAWLLRRDRLGPAEARVAAAAPAAARAAVAALLGAG